MAQELPNYSSLPKPAEKPSLPDGIIQLAVTPEKACSKKSRNTKVPHGVEGKKVCFAEEINEPEPRSACSEIQQGYQDLVKPQLNSTHGLSMKLEMLRTSQFQKERALKDLNIPESAWLSSVSGKTSSALNFKRNQTTFKDLINVDIDMKKELERAAPKRTSFEKVKPNIDDETDDDDIMTFWTADLVTETAKLDYDKDLDKELLEPNLCKDEFEYLGDFYMYKEIASQFR